MKPERSTGAPAGSTLETDERTMVVPGIAEIPAVTRSTGLSPRARRRFDIGSNVLIVAFAAAWIWTVFWGPPPLPETDDATGFGATRSVTRAITESNGTTTAFLTEAALTGLSFRGRSGKLLARFETPGEALPNESIPEGAHVVVARSDAPGDTLGPQRPAGVWRLALAVGRAIRPVADFSLITMRPFAEKRQGRIGGYMIGSWPAEAGRAVRSRYENPRGFIEVTLENRDTRVSEHFRLRDFLTKGQANVWPKYLVLEPRLVDKLELIISDLQARGIKVEHVTVMSGFRTPSYNAGGGNTAGRASLSRHMYGDGADVFVDNDRNGTMDDLNGDGRSDIGDVRIMAESADRVERAHPDLVGGVGSYIACCGHGPFIHIDTRGYRARWNGTSGG